MKTAKPLSAEPIQGITNEDLKILKASFPRDRLKAKIQVISKDRTRGLLVLYLQHIDVQNRLEEVDPAWSTEVLREDRMDEMVFVRLRLTLKGVSRENVGEGYDPKGAYSDALKRCAMLFGVGRYLYDSEPVWVPYDETRDRYRQWTVEDYDVALKAPELGKNSGSVPQISRSVPQAQTKSRSLTTREQLNRTLMNLYRPFLVRFPKTKFVELLTQRYGVGETRLMTLEQVQDLIQYMEEQLKMAA